MAMAFSLTMFGQMINIPGLITSKFKTDYSKAEEVKWSKDSASYLVSFIFNDQYTTIKYKEDGLILKKTQQVSYSELPEQARKKIDITYPSSMAEIIDKIVIEEDYTYYSVEIDAEGKQYTIKVEVNGEIAITEH